MAKPFFAPHHLGNLALPDYTFPQHIQDLEKDFLNLVKGKFNRISISLPVNHGKTWTAIVNLAWHILVFPEKEIIYCSHSADFSELQSFKIRQIIEQFGYITGVNLDPKYRSVGNWRTAQGGGVFATGINGNVWGRRASLICVDDAQKDLNTALSPVQSKRLFDWIYSVLFSRLHPDGKIILIGSRFSELDVIGRLTNMNDDLPLTKKWKIIRKPCLNEKNEALWPERFSAEELNNIRTEQELMGTSWIFSANYMSDPRGDPSSINWDDSYFPESIWYDDSPEGGIKIAAADPNVGRGDRIGDMGCVLKAIYKNNHLYIEGGYLQQAPYNKLVDYSVQMLKDFKPLGFMIETINAFKLISDQIYDAARQAGIHNPPIYNKDYLGESKKDRIRILLDPFLRSKRLHFKRVMENKIGMYQLRNFSGKQGQLDDYPDCIYLLTQCIAQLKKENKA